MSEIEDETKISMRAYYFSSCVTVLALALGLYFNNEVNKLQLSLTSARNELNNTMRAERQDLLIFNRVPKVGSQTLLRIINAMSALNNFTAYRDKEENVKKYGEITVMTPHDQRIEFCKMFEQFDYPATYTKHIAYIDFKELESLRDDRNFARQFADFHFKFEQPIYINMVREPVNRIISWYYYHRAPWYIVGKMQDGSVALTSTHTVKSLKQSYESCVLKGDPECLYLEGENFLDTGNGGQHASQIMFFCGHKPFCSVINGEQAFQLAKENVEKHYAVVGVLEELEMTFEVLSHYIPKFFRGVSKFYASIREESRTVNKNIFRPKVNKAIQDLVRRNLTREVDFYHFCRQRLHRQFMLIQD